MASERDEAGNRRLRPCKFQGYACVYLRNLPAPPVATVLAADAISARTSAACNFTSSHYVARCCNDNSVRLRIRLFSLIALRRVLTLNIAISLLGLRRGYWIVLQNASKFWTMKARKIIAKYYWFIANINFQLEKVIFALLLYAFSFLLLQAILLTMGIKGKRLFQLISSHYRMNLTQKTPYQILYSNLIKFSKMYNRTR